MLPGRRDTNVPRGTLRFYLPVVAAVEVLKLIYSLNIASGLSAEKEQQDADVGRRDPGDA